MPTYTFRLPAAFSSTAVTVYNTADVQQTTGTTDANATFSTSLPTGDYYAKVTYGYTSYRAAGEVDRGDLDGVSEAALFAPLGYGGNRFAFLGDSMTFGVSSGDSWPMYASILSNQRIRFVTNAGITGNTTAQMLARIQADVLAYSPDACTVLGGINDIINGVTPQTTRANLQTIYETLMKAGIRPVPCTILPNTTVDGTRKTKIKALNLWIRDYATANSLDLIDFYPRYVDPATGDYKAGVSSDNLHPDLAYKDLGQFVSDTLSPRLPVNGAPLAVDAHASGWNLLPNPMFLTDANADGVPDSWSALFGTGGQYAHALVTDAAIQGKWAQITMTAATGSRQLAYDAGSGNNPSFAVPGDTIALAARVDFTHTSGSVGADLQLRTDSATPVAKAAATLKQSVAGIAYCEYTLPANWAGRLQVYFVAPNGDGVYKIAQPTLYNLTKMKAYSL